MATVQAENAQIRHERSRRRSSSCASCSPMREPVRRRVHGIETFNVLRGGEYFFLPSLSALRWLGELR